MKKQPTQAPPLPKDILIVEDSATQAAVLKTALEENGWNVRVAGDGVEALEMIRLNKPAIVVSDIRMPNMDGYALSRTIKTDPALHDVPVVLLTSLSQSRDIIDAINSRADYYFLKQWSYDVLIIKIAAVLDSYQSLPGPSQGGLTVRFEGDSYTIEADAQQPLHLLLSTYEIAVQQSLELADVRDGLREANESLEETVRERTAQLTERNKEIGCLYAVSSLVAEPCSSIETALETAVRLIPPGLQYPEITCARIVFANKEYATVDFTETAWSLSADIVLSGKTAGTVEVYYLEEKPARDEGPFLKEEQELIVDVARQLGVLIERTQAEQTVHASEVRYRRLFEAAKDGILILDAETGTVVDENPFLCELLELPHEALVGRKVWDLGVLRDIVANQTRFEELTQKGYVRYEDLLLETSGGRRAAVEFISNVYLVNGRKVIQCNIRDITQRKQAEQRIQHLNRVLRAIRDVNQLIVRERDPQTLIQAACTILVDHRSYLGAIVILTDDKGCPRTYAHAGMLDTFHPMAARLDQGVLPPCCERAKVSAGDGVHWVTDRAAVCAGCPVADCFAETDTMLLPLRHRDELLGFFMIAVPHADAADAEEESLFTEAAGDIAFALYSIAMEAEQHKLTQQLAQAQKMESVGRLAGGVAHDFNNMLMGIMNYAELCRDKLETDHPIREWLNEITVDAERSAKLTHQLLAFARKQIIAPKVIDLNDAISGMLKLLRRLIGEDVTMKFTEDPDTWQVKMDPVQIDQILANLCVNARDAIGGVGSITIETSNAAFDESYCADHAGAIPGEYALLTVTDDGCGMNRETLEHIFEPFFTTKGAGEGTGLGLATVFGIVKQNDGFINVYSEPGEGTTFRIYLPRHEALGAPAAGPEAASKPPHGTETVLVVEDEKSIRITTDLFLKDLGYTVLVAEAPEQALHLAAQHSAKIDLLITDVIMPGMSGRDLAKRLLEIRPTIKRLFISGFTADVIAQRGILDDGVNFLSKPFGRDALARKVREVLEGQVKE